MAVDRDAVFKDLEHAISVHAALCHALGLKIVTLVQIENKINAYHVDPADLFTMCAHVVKQYARTEGEALH